jgi:hypothetical protein
MAPDNISPQVLPEKNRRTPVGKDKAEIAYAFPQTPAAILRHLIEESVFHS